MARWSSDQLLGPSYLQFLPPQNIEHSLASVIERRNASDSAPYLAVATVSVIHKQHVHIISVYILHYIMLHVWKITKTTGDP